MSKKYIKADLYDSIRCPILNHVIEMISAVHCLILNYITNKIETFLIHSVVCVLFILS